MLVRAFFLLCLLSSVACLNCTTSVLATLQANNATFSTLIGIASNDTAVATALSGCGLTLFAPTNAAFAAFNGTLPSGSALTDLLLYHVAPGAVNTSALKSGALVASALDLNATLGGPQQLTYTSATTKNNNTIGNINGITITNVSVSPQPTGGFVSAIDGILVPPGSILSVVASSNLATATAAVGAVPAVGAVLNTTDKLTAFLPTDAAFAALPAGYLDYLLANANTTLADVLEYHVHGGAVVYASEVKNESISTLLPGASIDLTADASGVQVNGNAVTKANVLASNGVVHEIAGVLIPPRLNVSTGGLLSALNLTSLLGALNATNLTSAVADSATPLTVFAPTNEAFADVSDATSNITTEQLSSVLLNHVVAGENLKLVVGTNLTTLANTTLLIGNTTDGNLTVQLLNTSEVAGIVAGPTYALKLGKPFGSYYVIDKVLGVPGNPHKKKNSDKKDIPWAIIGGVIGGVIGLVLILIIVAVAVVVYMAVSAGGFGALMAKYQGYDSVE